MELHDIFPAIKVTHYTLYVILGMFVLFVFFFVHYAVRKKKKKNRSYYIHILKKYHQEDAKHTAYLFSYYGKKIVKDETQKALLSTINQSLYEFKFIQEQQTVPKNIRHQIEHFLHTIGK